MSLRGTHTVTIKLIDDDATGPRLDRAQDATVVATTARCRVNQIGIDRVDPGRAAAVHKFKVHFDTPTRLTNSHQIIWTGPDGVTRVLSVVGTKARRSPSMPDVAFCEWHDDGPLT